MIDMTNRCLGYVYACVFNQYVLKFLLEMFNIKFELEREVLFQINSFASFRYIKKPQSKLLEL